MIFEHRKLPEIKPHPEAKDREVIEDSRKIKEKDKIGKEEIVPIRIEKEVKKIDTIVPKKPEVSVSPKKTSAITLPVTRHRVIYTSYPALQSLYHIYLYRRTLVFSSSQRACLALRRRSKKLKISSLQPE